MTTKQVAVRLKTEGKAEVKRDAAEIGDALENAYQKGVSGAAQASAAAESHERALKSAAVQGQNLAAAQERITARQMAADQAKANALRGQLDPLWAAQQRLNTELAEYTSLAERGVISSRELADAQALARRRFDETANSINRQGNVISLAQRRYARLDLMRQGADVFTTAAMGMNPAMIAIQQGPQILDGLAMSGVRATGSMVALGAAVGVVAGGIAILAAGWLKGESTALAYDRAVTGLGRTSGLTADQLRDLTIAGAEQGEVALSSAQKQAEAYLATGRIGGEIIERLITIGRDYASVMGLDAEQATQSLAQAMLAPDQAGRELTRTMGLLTQAQLDQIDAAMRSGDIMDAQRILVEALDDAMSDHAGRVGTVTNAWDALARSIGDAITRFGEWLYVTEGEQVERRVQTLDRQIRSRDRRIDALENGSPLAAATTGIPGRFIFDQEYRQQAADRLRREQEADREAIRGIRAEQDADRREAEAQSQRWRDNQNAQLARDRVTARGGGGGSRVGGGSDAGERAQREAERDAEAAARRAQQLIDYRLQSQIALARASGQETAELEQQLQIREATQRLVGLGVPEAEARAEAERYVTALARAEAEERARDAAERAEERAARLSDIRLRRDIDLARVRGQSTEELERELRLRELIAQYEGAGLTTAEARVEAQRDLVAYTEAEAEARRRAIETNAEAMAELKTASETAFDRMSALIEQGKTDWADWKEAGLSAIRELWAAFIRLAAINPLKNALFGGDAPTITNSGGFLGQILGAFGGGGTASSSAGGQGGGFWGNMWNVIMNRGGVAGQGVPGNAGGTDYWRGGLTWVGESGRELVALPRGSQVFDHVRSEGMARRGPEVVRASMPITIVTPNPQAFQASKAQIAAQMGRMFQMAQRVT